jgi:hypothetical protein
VEQTSSDGSFCCLNIWSHNLTSLEMLEAASCESPGDICSMREENIQLYGSVTSETGKHPEDSTLHGEY